MILALKTDGPICEMNLYENSELKAQKDWQAGRGLALGLLTELETFLHESDLTWRDLSGLIVFQGPGSFTGLRIGITVMNTLADSLNIPIIGTTGDGWLTNGLKLFKKGQSHRFVLPEYGSLPNITLPKK